MFRRHDREVLAMAVFVFGAALLTAAPIPAARPLQDLMGQLFAPIQRMLTVAGSSLGGVFGNVETLQVLREQVTQLQTENARLQTESLKVGDLRRENATLRGLAAFRQARPDLDLQGASVTAHKIAEEPGSLVHSIEVDVGARHGIKPFMAVASERGLVGQVTSVSASRAWVRLLIDPRSQIGAKVQRSRVTGMVVGSTTGVLTLRYLPQSIAGEPLVVQRGDIIETSGESEYFPAGLTIGQVLEVHQSDERTHQEATLLPSVNFSALEKVLVITGWPGPAETGTDPSGPDSTSSGVAGPGSTSTDSSPDNHPANPPSGGPTAAP